MREWMSKSWPAEERKFQRDGTAYANIWRLDEVLHIWGSSVWLGHGQRRALQTILKGVCFCPKAGAAETIEGSWLSS